VGPAGLSDWLMEMRPDPHTTPYQTPIIVGGDRVVSQIEFLP